MDYFLAFYSLYPRKSAPARAEKAAKKIKPEQWPEVMEGLKRYIAYWKQHGTEKGFIPYPATWLNGQQWLDEIETIEEERQESASEQFLKAVRNPNNKTKPDLPIDITRAFFKMQIPWKQFQIMHDDEIISRFNQAFIDKPIPLDRKTLAAGGE